MSAATLRQSLTSVRSRIRVSEAEARRTGSAYVAAAAIGAMSRRNDEGVVPMSKLEVFGLPGTVVVAIGAKVAATFSSGDMADYANGIGDAAAVIAISKFVQGEWSTLAGDGEVGSRRARRAKLRRELERLRDAAGEELEHDDLRDAVMG